MLSAEAASGDPRTAAAARPQKMSAFVTGGRLTPDRRLVSVGGGSSGGSFSGGRRRLRSGSGGVAVQANLFSRVTRIVKSYADALVSAAEDPEKILDQTVKEMQADLIKMKQTSASVIASQKSIQAKYEQAQQTADDWVRRAELALQKGDEELAREALKRKRSYQESADQLGKQLEYQAKAAETLIANTRQLESKLAEAKSKKDTLKARAQSAKASRAVNEMVGSLSTSNAVNAFERMEEKVVKMEAESDATRQLVAGDEVEGRFRELEGLSVEDELRAMKEGKLPENTVKGQLPEGRPLKDAVDLELEELRRKAQE